MLKRFFYLTIPCLLGLTGMSLSAQEVEVTITGLKTAKGQIVIGVFKDDPTFQKEDAFLSLKFEKEEIKNGEMKIEFKMEPGLYGLTLLDDENNSGLMEYNLIGIPKEGFGFSDYYHSGIKKPKFDAFRFNLEKDQKKKIIVKVRYM
jgi:uncharacterized protein (DUF2141 family)